MHKKSGQKKVYGKKYAEKMFRKNTQKKCTEKMYRKITQKKCTERLVAARHQWSILLFTALYITGSYDGPYYIMVFIQFDYFEDVKEISFGI